MRGPKGYAHGRPQFLPGGRSLLFTLWGASSAEDRGPALLSLEKGTWTHVASGIWSARYARSGHLLLSGPRGVRAAPFDPDRPQPTNPQTFVVDEVFSTLAWSDSWFAVSDTGTLAYVPGDTTLGRLAWVERDGRVSPVSDSVVSLSDACVSPDGERIAFQDRDDNLWTLDLRRGTRDPSDARRRGLERLPGLVPGRLARAVRFEPERRLGDHLRPRGRRRRDSGPHAEGESVPPVLWLPTGRSCSTSASKGKTAAVLSTLSPDGSVTPFLDSPWSTVGGQLSPDGRAVAYVSDETGRDEVYVRPFGREGAAAPVSTDGGTAPRWSPDGREVFYRRGDAFLAASVTSAGGTLTASDSQKLFEVRAAPGRTTIQAGYSMSPDGRRFLVHLLDPRAVPTRINVVLNWFDELEAKVPVR